MYTVVLMAAMSGAPELPDFCRGRCRCNGCFCGCRCGGSCGGCYCGGCYCGGCCHGGYCGGYCHGGYCGGCCHTGGYYNGGGAPYGQPPMKGGEPVPAPKKKTDSKEEVRAPATLIVNLPANARLSIDGHATRATSAQRIFISPPLEPGRDYVYNLRAEITREDGQPTTTTQQVMVRAGQETRVTLDLAVTVAASQ